MDSLYGWKAESETELEKLRAQKRPEPTLLKEILDIKIKNGQEKVEMLSTIIKSYLSHHGH